LGFIGDIYSIIANLDSHLAEAIATYGATTYLLLFLIIFCETGLVLTPFLPGDSLLFLIGTFVAKGDFDFILITSLLIIAAILGDAVNYYIGSLFGRRIFTSGKVRFLKLEYLERTEKFFDKYGAKTIIIARFIPIVRTYAPFVAGVARYSYPQFLLFNVVGACIWVFSLVGVGFFLGELPFIQNNLTVVIFLIILLSITPALIEWLKVYFRKQ
jgi:membrane-associated protein